MQSKIVNRKIANSHYHLPTTNYPLPTKSQSDMLEFLAVEIAEASGTASLGKRD